MTPQTQTQTQTSLLANYKRTIGNYFGQASIITIYTSVEIILLSEIKTIF